MKKNSPTTQSYPRDIKSGRLSAFNGTGNGLDKGALDGIVKHGKTGWVEANSEGFTE